jgi:hypothetical protein
LGEVFFELVVGGTVLRAVGREKKIAKSERRSTYILLEVEQKSAFSEEYTVKLKRNRIVGYVPDI